MTSTAEEDCLFFEREDITIKFNVAGMTIKKNGLTIHIPQHILTECKQEFQTELDRESASLLDQIRSFKK